MKDPKYWTTTFCQQCGEEFEVRKRRLKKGGGKFCSLSCSTTYRNIHNNPANVPEARKKISQNHADVSGENNPMYGVKLKGEDNPAYIDGRSKYGEYYRMIAFKNKPHKCNICGKEGKPKDFDVHHKDGNRENNKLNNLEILCPKCHQTIGHILVRDEKGRFMEVVNNAR